MGVIGSVHLIQYRTARSEATWWGAQRVLSRGALARVGVVGVVVLLVLPVAAVRCTLACGDAMTHEIKIAKSYRVAEEPGMARSRCRQYVATLNR